MIMIINIKHVNVCDLQLHNLFANNNKRKSHWKLER